MVRFRVSWCSAKMKGFSIQLLAVMAAYSKQKHSCRTINASIISCVCAFVLKEKKAVQQSLKQHECICVDVCAVFCLCCQFDVKWQLSSPPTPCYCDCDAVVCRLRSTQLWWCQEYLCLTVTFRSFERLWVSYLAHKNVAFLTRDAILLVCLIDRLVG